MAKKKMQSENVRYAVNKKALKNARAQAALEQAQLEKRQANREKSRRMSTAFLLGVLTLIAAYCLYALVRTLFFRRASSLEDLRASLLFVSTAAIPCLLGFGAYLIHRLLKKRREGGSDRAKRLGSFLLILVCAAAFILFGVQLRGGRRDASAQPPYADTAAALKRSGLAVREPESVESVRTLLEEAICTELRCGETTLRLNYHADGSGRIPRRFLDQAARDYARFPQTEPAAGVTLWGPAESDGTARAALAELRDGKILILELSGPKAELEALIPLLTAGAEP